MCIIYNLCDFGTSTSNMIVSTLEQFPIFGLSATNQGVKKIHAIFLKDGCRNKLKDHYTEP